MKYRSSWDKRFWYAKGGHSIRDLIYGMDVVYQHGIKRVAIVEAEVDALTLWSLGIPAIATGGAAFNDKKRDMILRSPIEEIVIIRDNDKAGRAWRNMVVEAFKGKLSVGMALVPRGYKDVNEARNIRIGKARLIERKFPYISVTV
ncbi:DNA primase [compost metagenome]